MLSMTEKTLVGLVVTLAVVFAASLVLPVWTYEARLSTSPSSSKISVPQGRHFNVTCQGDSSDNGIFKSMRWLNPKGEKVSTGVEQVGRNTLLLTFENPKQADSGVYKCLALYENKHMEIHVSIIFYGPRPEFESGYETLEVKEGDRVELLCQATGDEPLTYEWLDKNEERISPDSNSSMYISTLANGSALIIEKVHLDHDGVYMCTAANSHGMSNKLYELRVGRSDGNDTESILNVKAIKITATSVRFSLWTPQTVTSIEVKYYESRDPSMKYTNFTKGVIYEVSELIPGGKYYFQFRSASTSSEVASDWTGVYEVTLLPDKPDVIIRSLREDSLKIEWMRMVDDIMRQTTDKFQLKYYTLQRLEGSSWQENSCATTVELPTCTGSSFTIAGLSRNIYYQFELRAHTVSGFGEAYKSKFFLS